MAACALAVVVIAALGYFVTRESQTPQAAVAADSADPLVLQEAYEACIGGTGSRTLTLADEGRSILIDTESEYGPVEKVACVMSELDTSQAIVAQMDSTTSMMGVQEASDGDINYQWSYHPDNGINMVITDSSE